jgi:hypothetical protein
MNNEPGTRNLRTLNCEPRTEPGTLNPEPEPNREHELRTANIEARTAGSIFMPTRSHQLGLLIFLVVFIAYVLLRLRA